MIILKLSDAQARKLLKAISGPSVTDLELAKIYEQIKNNLK